MNRVAAAAAAAAAMVAVSACSSSGGPAAPSFTPAPGAFRVAAKVPGNGAPPEPQLLTAGSTRVLVAFGGAFRRDNHAVAGMSLQLLGSPTTHVAGQYRAGSVIRLGSVLIRVLGVYDQAGENHDLVDLKITPT